MTGEIPEDGDPMILERVISRVVPEVRFTVVLKLSEVAELLLMTKPTETLPVAIPEKLISW